MRPWGRGGVGLGEVPQGGGGGTQQSFIPGGSALRSKPLPFYIPFFPEKVPAFCVPSIENCMPFRYLRSDFY